MFSKEESKRLRQEFWISFGKSFPRKWILYNTKIKDVSFKFHFDTKQAKVSLDIECVRNQDRVHYFEKLISLKSILLTSVPELVIESNYQLANGKEISSLYTSLEGVSIHNKNTWQETMYFLKDNMSLFEEFWETYEDYIKS